MIRLGSKVRVETRLFTLYYLIFDLMQQCGASESSLNAVKLGVYDRQVLRQIILYYIDDHNNRVGELSFTIDWDQYKLSIEQGLDSFELDPRRPVPEQISNRFNILVEHLNNLRQDHHVTKIETCYIFNKEYIPGSSRYRELQKYLGTCSTSANDFGKPMSNLFSINMSSNKLSELSVGVKTLVQPDTTES